MQGEASPWGQLCSCLHVQYHKYREMLMSLPLLLLQSDTSALNMDPETVLAGEPDKKFQPDSPAPSSPTVNARVFVCNQQSTSEQYGKLTSPP